MYHPDVVAAREERILRSPTMRRLFPDGIPVYSVEENDALLRGLLAARKDDGTFSRSMTIEESRYLAATPVRCAIDFRYFATRFAVVDDQGHGLRRLSTFSESQTFVLGKIATLELKRWGTHPDGLLFNVLKARQLFVSTLSEVILGHRILFQPYTRALCGADVEEQAGYLFRMVVRLYDGLPWFLQPSPRFPFVKNRELGLSNSSFLKVAWGKSTRGALQSTTGTEGSKGAIGRGQTYGTVHLSELPTWDNPDQIDSALLPAIPVHPDTFVVFEATAEYSGDWWHLHYLATKDGVGRFTNIFVPVYAEPTKYSLPAPLDWTPSSTSIKWAAKCERTSTQWYPETVHLTRDQIYWYETTRAFYEKKNDLGSFLKEYCADDLECFQYAGRSIFSLAQLDAIDEAGSRRPLLDVWSVEPARDVAELRRLPMDGPGALPPPAIKRPDPPLSMRVGAGAMSPLAGHAFPVPAGYGFQRLTKEQLAELQNLRGGVLAIWEYPRTRGKRRYVMSVDVSEGLGLDYSVIDIIRLPTIEESTEQVAQFVSNLVDTKQLAFVCDAIGHLYPDEDGVEALAAIETNNVGLATQDALQLHLGYTAFYVWEYADSASPDRRYSSKIGWVTTTRTRPILLTAFKDAITTFDPITGAPDFILNSPITRGELRHFITPDVLANAEAARGQHDDCIMAGAIGYYVAWRLAGGEHEPIAEKRRRRAALAAQAPPDRRQRLDYRNSAMTTDEIAVHMEEDDEFADDVSPGSTLHFDPRTQE